jgi:acyl-[acyl-carrier-protein]-phospholipid O-acyltransferase/long-chain-fatty-acid--[acyl-carrier-protein] ligase
MSLRMFRIAVALSARKIAALSEPGETIGVMLPNANGAALTFMALQAAGCVPAMLNFTPGAHKLIAACEGTRIRLVLTSRAFV